MQNGEQAYDSPPSHPSRKHDEHDEHDGFERRPAGRERGSRGPRVFASGDLKLLLLALIGEQPCHGYDLIRRIENMFDGAYSPSPGVIYPTLTFLEMGVLIAGNAEGGKKRYSVTDAGRLFLEDQAPALNEVRMRIEASKRSLRGQDRPRKSTKRCITCAMRCTNTMAGGARKKPCGFVTCSTTPPKPLSTVPTVHLFRSPAND